jgi:hypothetical protein
MAPDEAAARQRAIDFNQVDPMLLRVVADKRGLPESGSGKVIR